MSTEERWLKTSEAAYHLGVSQWYLKQCRDCYEDGFLKEREHYILGASRTAAIRWNISAILDTLHNRGKLVRVANQEIRNIQKGN